MSARVEIYREELAFWEGPETGGIGTRLGKWRWRFIKNGRIMADSGQGYSRRIDALNGCATVLGGEVSVEDDGREFVMRGSILPGTRWSPVLDSVLVLDLTREVAS